MNRQKFLATVLVGAGVTLFAAAIVSVFGSAPPVAGVSQSISDVPVPPSDTPVSLPAPTGLPTETPEIAASAVPTVAAPTATPTPVPLDLPSLGFDGNQALDFAASQMQFGDRPTGSQALRDTADYILSTLGGFGWVTDVQPFVYQDTDGQNLVGKKGPDGAPVILLGAHYDTRRQADQDPQNPDQPVPGANDGASGVAVLLELARVLDFDLIDYQVWLVFFDAEDNGNLDGWEYIAGSTIFAEQMQVTPAYVIIVDMIGDADQQVYLERNSDAVLQNHLFAVAHGLGYQDSFIPEYKYGMLDDHTPFARLGIPAVDLIDFDYPYWHTTEDTLDKLSAESLERVGRVLEAHLELGGDY